MEDPLLHLVVCGQVTFIPVPTTAREDGVDKENEDAQHKEHQRVK